MINLITRETLRDQARNIILKQILHGELRPGEPINLSEVSGNLGISRTPLREALLSLVEQGLVGTEVGNKTFHVWPLTLKEARSLGQLAQALEGLAVRTTARVDQKRILEMRTANSKLAGVQGKPRGMIKWDDRWHELLTSGTENKEVQRVLGETRKRFYRYRWYGYDCVALRGSDEKMPSVAQHAEITDALERGEIEHAAQLVSEHWARAIVLLERWLPKSESFREIAAVEG